MPIKVAHCTLQIDYDDSKTTADDAAAAVAELIDRAVDTPGVLDAVGSPAVGCLELVEVTEGTDGHAEAPPEPRRPPLDAGEQYYDVTLVRNATESVTIVVAANSPGQAEDRAEALAGTYGENCAGWELDENPSKVYIGDTPTLTEE